MHHFNSDVTGTHPVTGLFPSRRGEPAVKGKQAEARAAAKQSLRHHDIIPVVLETGGLINREGLALISLARWMYTSGIREHGIPVTYTRARATLTQHGIPGAAVAVGGAGAAAAGAGAAIGGAGAAAAGAGAGLDDSWDD